MLCGRNRNPIFLCPSEVVILKSTESAPVGFVPCQVLPPLWPCSPTQIVYCFIVFFSTRRDADCGMITNSASIIMSTKNSSLKQLLIVLLTALLLSRIISLLSTLKKTKNPLRQFVVGQYSVNHHDNLVHLDYSFPKVVKACKNNKDDCTRMMSLRWRWFWWWWWHRCS